MALAMSFINGALTATFWSIALIVFLWAVDVSRTRVVQLPAQEPEDS